jgi:RNA polymerase sigma-70 factor, ECF subfamily
LTEHGGGSEFERARRAADETLYRNHVGKVYGLCLRMTANRATAEDCTQEAFIQAWRRLPAFESRSAFGTWLHRIAVNAVLAQGRRRSERLGTSGSAEDEAAALADPAVGDPGTVLDLEAGLRRLPAGARQALVLVGLYGYSHEEAAELLGVAVGTCKSQVHRARQLLGERLAVTEVAR